MMWKDKYKVGVSLIDTQHEELFKRVSEFIEAVQSNDNWEAKLDKVKETMVFMQEYVVIHFNAEEAYQEKINYPDIENHKKIHRDFKKMITDYIAVLKQNGYPEKIVQELGGKLMAWLIMHVAKTDQQIGEYVKSQGGEI
ncbi:bacteriohemerythrin [Clostridium homopropionicum DSM 5847]|uniref:Bacteriohemerythrin n=1 Tax=Clostridium homopropionicum DSM 5847 TaxID=1121318 RepID=A0A0L6Z746_9CLOT|nr:hemerythrin family protein [Clostridium homopropionicum]KOA18648.1 bacteriohemerythrin [Clostridium homopropionicum DSM 5847]SFG51322.1 hemerythrin [Clostridium homopropionicum]